MSRAAGKLPKYVKLSGGRYVYRPYIPAALRDKFDTDKYGYLRPPIGLGPPDTPLYKIHAAQSALEEQMQFERIEKYHSLHWLYAEYLKSRLFLKCEPKTQKRYRESAKILSHEIDINSKAASFGDLMIDQVTTPMIRSLLDKRYDQYQKNGKDGASQCNNEKALLSNMFRYALQYVESVKLLGNPCKNIDSFKTKVRNRYVTHAEYAIQMEFALKSGLDYLPVAMELTYLLAARGIEATELRYGHADETGILVERKKGSRNTRVRWNARLLFAWTSALALHDAESISADTPIFKKQRGTGGISREGLSTAWQRKLKQPMEEAGHGDVYFQTHDLKRKGVSDAENDKIAGHVSDKVRSDYNVRAQEFDAPK